MSGKTNILHIIDALNYGGAQQLLVLIARFTPREKYNVAVCVLQDNNEIRPQLERENVKVFSLNKKRCSVFNFLGFLIYVFSVLKGIVNICRHEKIDVIQCHLSDAEFLGILSGRLNRVGRIITTVHYPDLLPQRTGFSPRNLLRLLSTRMLYRWTNAVIAVSTEVARNIEKIYNISPEKIHTIPNRVDVESFQIRKNILPGTIHPGLTAEHRILCLVGRLMPPKGHSHLFQAMTLLRREYPEIRLLLVGDGELRSALEDLSKSLGISENVIFLGSRPDIPEILSVTEIFVFSSLWEGISLALIEAMAAGKPIVATEIPGNRELIKHGVNGLLVPKADSEALAMAIKKFLDEPVFSSELGANAIKDAKEKFDISLTIKELEDVWQGRDHVAVCCHDL
jgi:L-malate glycosyltransferase